MEVSKTELGEWAERYVRHRDLFKREIERLEPTNEGFDIVKKDGSVTRCLVMPKFILPEKLSDTLIVTRNLKENVLAVVNGWKLLAAEESCIIVFANILKNEKWVLVPRSHARIADPSNLKNGLLALYNTLPEG